MSVQYIVFYIANVMYSCVKDNYFYFLIKMQITFSQNFLKCLFCFPNTTIFSLKLH